MSALIDPAVPDHAYLIGLVHADGHLSVDTRGRGKLTIELVATDAPLLARLAAALPVHAALHTRRRVTNFGENDFTALTVHDRRFRAELAKYVPIGPKAHAVAPPEGVVLPDYLRGYIDGNGSVGICGRGDPFVCLATRSAALASAYVDFLHNLLGVDKHVARNRDGLFSLTVLNEDAQAVVRALWHTPGCLALPRKAAKAAAVLAWVRTRPKAPRRHRWTAAEVEFLRTHTLPQCLAAFPHLTHAQVDNRRFRAVHGRTVRTERGRR